MKFVDEYRDPERARQLADSIRRTVTKPWSIMEVCGGQTHAIVRFGLDGLLPDSLTLIHGPGCPVCVTPVAMIDRALAIAARPEVIFCSFGDMLRVPGSERDLFQVKSEGAQHKNRRFLKHLEGFLTGSVEVGQLRNQHIFRIRCREFRVSLHVLAKVPEFL